MPLTKLQIAPGIDKQNTEYGAEGFMAPIKNYMLILKMYMSI